MLHIPFSDPIDVDNGGLFVSPGKGGHPDRTMDTYELIFVRSGRLAMMEREKRFDLQAGQCLLLYPHRRHRGCGPYEKDLSFYWIHFRFKNASSKKSGLCLPQLATPARPDRMAELFHRLLDGQEAGDFGPHEAGLLLLLLLSEASRPAVPKSQSSPSGPSALALALIAKDFRKGLRPSDVARALRLNPDYLGRLFRKAQGCTLTEAIHREQLREARSLLREGLLNLDETARACGFGDARYFRRIFRRYHGLNPRPYRKLHTRVHINTS